MSSLSGKTAPPLRVPDVGINGYQGYAWIHRLMAQTAEARGLCRYSGFADYGAASESRPPGVFQVPDLTSLVARLRSPGVILSQFKAGDRYLEEDMAVLSHQAHRQLPFCRSKAK